jgi:hypothetical protein
MWQIGAVRGYWIYHGNSPARSVSTPHSGISPKRSSLAARLESPRPASPFAARARPCTGPPAPSAAKRAVESEQASFPPDR